MRRVRSALIIAGLWAVAWLPVGIGLGLGFGWLHLPPRDSLEAIYLACWPVFGALSGGVFSLVFATLERRRAFDQLSTLRTALWGMLGGSTVPIALIVLTRISPNIGLNRQAPPVFASMAILGAVCGAGMLLLARRGRAVEETGAPSA